MLPEQDPQAPSQDTPDISAPDPGTPDEPQINWQKRYEDLRPQFDRTNQELARLNDESYQRELMARWGYEVEDPEPGYAPDPNDEVRQKLAELEEWKNTQEQQREQAQQLEQITASVADQFRQAGGDLDERTREWVTTRALNMDPREDGMPDIQGAINDYNAWVTEQQQQWEQSRKRPRAPHVPPGGQAGTDAPNLDDREQRRAWMAEQLAARENG
jgi:hypothetical protein